MFRKSKLNLDMIDVSSRMSLKMSCIRACGGDISKATDLYDFLVKDIGAIPDFPVTPPSMVQQIKETVGSIFGWVKENREDIVQAVGFVQSIVKKPSAAPVTTEIPPLP